ncbi:hypothetical protein EV200_105289 [Pedobacter psychrotolerans]|uniref:Uncharacterized protein n=1 Tax=Pedobacter psychrotolerans TaxID=1843235 RepID=A0A4R2HAL1_9SPHI|nr:hypothetical protein [Pedobacter psychrotolerans]TCO23815.1 hypothetical protein EV200_105289 [Pedobacter psychrotolerans]GGE62794.1 hypothetical protein GCM10011413_31490 [Pedobacter psychrotolerans]
MNYYTFYDIVTKWCDARGKDFTSLAELRGGWEPWAQTDLSLYIKNMEFQPRGFLREAVSGNVTASLLQNNNKTMLSPGFAKLGQKADMIFDNGTLEILLVELKCESLENRQNFSPGLSRDVEKLKGCGVLGRRIAVGICISPEYVEKAIKEKGFEILWQKWGATCLVYPFPYRNESTSVDGFLQNTLPTLPMNIFGTPNPLPTPTFQYATSMFGSPQGPSNLFK